MTGEMPNYSLNQPAVVVSSWKDNIIKALMGRLLQIFERIPVRCSIAADQWLLYFAISSVSILIELILTSSVRCSKRKSVDMRSISSGAARAPLARCDGVGHLKSRLLPAGRIQERPWATCDLKPFGHPFNCSSALCLRVSEPLNLRIKEVDLKQGRSTFARPKENVL